MNDTAAGGATAGAFWLAHDGGHARQLAFDCLHEARSQPPGSETRVTLEVAHEALHALVAALVARSEELAAQQSLAQQIAVEWRGLKVAIAALYAELVALRAVAEAARVYLTPDTGPLTEQQRKSPYGAFLQAVRDYDAARQSVAPVIGKTARQYAQERSARDPEFAAALAALRQPVAPDPPDPPDPPGAVGAGEGA